MSEEKLKPTYSEYKGSPVITIFINNNETYKFSFGLGKAKAILNYLDEIRTFVEEHDKPKD